ncbi:MAG: hypothetical protein H0V89_06000 [Deltaproteobacteria bacterium]|nr:hypothetical protein [Deltaproteobacteria bacterium]
MTTLPRHRILRASDRLFHSPKPGQRYLQKPFSQRQLTALLVDLAR